MKKQFAFVLVVLLAGSASAAIIGEDPVENDGAPDGWSGLTFLTDDYPTIEPLNVVQVVNYYAGDRADGNHNVQPVIVQQDNGGIFSIWGIGPVSTPTAEGAVQVVWNSPPIPNDANTYHAGVWQWNTGVDNDAGGLVPFGNGGLGMKQTDRNGIDYVPFVGDVLDIGHESGPGGRAYQFNFVTSDVPIEKVDDLNGDGDVNELDFFVLSDNLAAELDGVEITPMMGDRDFDMDVDLDDFGDWKAANPAAFAAGVAALASIPEPNTLTLVLTAMLGLWGTFRRRQS